MCYITIIGNFYHLAQYRKPIFERIFVSYSGVHDIVPLRSLCLRLQMYQDSP